MASPKSGIVALVIGCALFPAAALHSAETAPTSSVAALGAVSPETFLHPTSAAGVHVWWHWMDGAITREGLTKDLETMKAQGVAQATILNVGLFEGRNFGVPRVPFGSPEWFGMYRWAVSEAARLGLTLGVHNCDGWSSSGGPWITPEQSMKQFTWSRAFVAGGRTFDAVLPEPGKVAGFYRDVALVACRTDRVPGAFAGSDAELTINGQTASREALVDGNPISGVVIKRGDTFTYALPAGLDFSRVAIHLRRPFMWSKPTDFTVHVSVEASSDGKNYRPVSDMTVRGLNHTAVLDVPPTKAPFVRFGVRDLSEADAWIPVQLSELELLRAGETPASAPSIPAIAQKTASVKGPEHAVDEIGDDHRAIAPSDVVVLTERVGAGGRLRWEAPPGTWMVYRFGYTTTGATNGPATAEGLGLECDKMDPVAVDRHFDAFAGKLIDDAGVEAGRTLRFILIDSWEAGFQNWTARFPEEFARRRGYSLIPWLPVLTGETVSSARESEAVLHDFRRTIADLIRENYYDHFASLLHRRNIELHAEVIYGGAAYPPLDVLQAAKNVDLPMLEFWTSANSNSLLAYDPVAAPSLELPVAAAVGYGKTLVGSEAYTGFAHYSESPADLKPFGDRGYAGGINRMILHSSVHQPTDEKPGMTLGQWASHFNRNNPYWSHARSWLDYQARIQSVLGEGTPIFDVLHFLGDQLPQVYERDAATSLPPGFAVTAVNADLLASRITVANHRLQLNGQGEAALLSLPPQAALSLETLRRLDVLVRAGAHVYGPKPVRPLSLDDVRHASEFASLADRIWGNVDGTSVFTHRHGEGNVSWGRPIGEVLAEQQVAPQFEAQPATEKTFLFTHRRTGETEVFFVANQTDERRDTECRFRVGARTPELWDPESGAISRPAAFRIEGDQLVLPVRFQPRQAWIFVFRAGLPPRYITSIARDETTLFPAPKAQATRVPELRFEAEQATIAAAVSGNYRFVTNDGRTLTGNYAGPDSLPLSEVRMTLALRGPGAKSEPPFEIADLRPLTDYAAPAIRYFCGEATYGIKFRVAASGTTERDRLLLDLGGFEAIAEATLNGRTLGQFWKPGLPIEVTGILRGENELSIRVVTVYRNRLIGDFAEFGSIKQHTSSPLSSFLSAKSPLKPSGLFGPITMLRIRREKVSGW